MPRRRGARFYEGAAVTGIEVTGGRVAGVRTSAGEIATRTIFNCAGPWAREIGAMAGQDIPVEPSRNIMVTGAVPRVSRTSPMTVDF